MDNRRRQSGNRYRPNQYNNSSEAYDYEHLHYRNPRDDRGTSTAIIRQRKQKDALKKKRIIMLKQREELRKDRLNHILCYILAFYVFGMSVFILNQFDSNNVIETEISRKQDIINEQEKEISSKKIALASSVDVHEIENYARNNLGMKTPSSDQLVYVTLPKNRSYLEYSKPNVNNEQPTSSTIEQEEFNSEISDEHEADNNIDDIEVENGDNNVNSDDTIDETMN